MKEKIKIEIFFYNTQNNSFTWKDLKNIKYF